MDPQATWTALLHALLGREWPAAQVAAEALVEWLQRGGFSPRIVAELPPEHPLHRTFVLTVCEEVLQVTDVIDANG
jgi:hypothetical protein